jgi:hypothetical protein
MTMPIFYARPATTARTSAGRSAESETMIKRLGQTAMAVVVAGSLALGAHAAAAAGGQTSFKAMLSGTAMFASQTTVLFSGSGSATRMGQITNDGSIVITGSDSSCSGGVANTNTEKLTDNDGDTLTTTSRDVACPIGPGQFHGTGQWTVTGGTGRFSGASGHGTTDGYSDFGAGTFTITLTGVLVIPHA